MTDGRRRGRAAMAAPDGERNWVSAAAVTQYLRKKWVWGWRMPPPGARRSSQGQRSGATRVADRIELKLCYHVRNGGGKETELLDCIAIVLKGYIYMRAPKS